MATKDKITFGGVDGLIINRNSEECWELECLGNFSAEVNSQIREIICDIRDGVKDIRRLDTRGNVSFEIRTITSRTTALSLGEGWGEVSLSSVSEIGDNTTPTLNNNPEWRIEKVDGNMVLSPRHVSTWSMSSSSDGAGDPEPSGTPSAGTLYYEQDDDVFHVYVSGGTPFGISDGWYEIPSYNETRTTSAGSPPSDPDQADDLHLVINIDDTNDEIDAILYYSAADDTSWESQANMDSQFDYEAIATFGSNTTMYWSNDVFLEQFDIEPIEWEGVTGKNPSFPSTEVNSAQQAHLWAETNGSKPFSFKDITTQLDDMTKPTWDNPDGKNGVAFNDWEVQSVSSTNPDGYTSGDTFSTFDKQLRILDQCLGKIRVYATDNDSNVKITYDRATTYNIFGDVEEDSDLIHGDDALRFGFAYSYDGIRDNSGTLITARTAVEKKFSDPRPILFQFHHDFDMPNNNVNRRMIIRVFQGYNEGGLSLSSSNTDDNEIILPTNYIAGTHRVRDVPLEFEFVESNNELESISDIISG